MSIVKKSVRQARSLLLAALALGMVGCVPKHLAPSIVDISDSKVVVKQRHYASGIKNTATDEDVLIEATRGCRQFGKVANLVSSVCAAQGIEVGLWPLYQCHETNYLFSCLAE